MKLHSSSESITRRLTSCLPACRPYLAGLLLFSVGIALPASISAQEEEGGGDSTFSLLPTNLRHGVNLPYVFGNANYNLAKQQRPYEQDRLNALLTPSDFEMIKHPNAQDTTHGFDHVRIPIYPACLGMDPVSGNFAPDSSQAIPESDSTRTQIYAALDATVQEAIAKNLAVVIDFHPFFICQKHYNYMIGINAAG